jgi:two-component system KDP operon response regulator KdpE
MDATVLLIDDDPGLLTLLKLGLERDGFIVLAAANGTDGIRKAYEHHPDVVILDVMMDEMDGWETCQRLRQICDTPILMLTALTSGEDVIKGLSLGADDYLTKPCDFGELRARIRALLRRRGHTDIPQTRRIYDDGTLHVNLWDGTVKRRGQVVDLTPTESRLLMYLASQRGRIVPRRELLINVWGPEYAKELGYLSVYIRYLRRKIEQDPSNPRYIRTRWKVGYYFAHQDAQ